MQILRDILYGLSVDAPIEEVRRGLHSTAVVSRVCGLASTVIEENCHDSQEGEPVRSFAEMMALELARYALSDDVSKASLGLAAINSLIAVKDERCTDIDGLKLIHEIGKDKNITVIGHFPFLDALAKVAQNLWIIEKHPKQGDLPEKKGSECLPQSDIIVITSTTLINHTIQGILDLCRKESVKMLLGPTTPMAEVLFDHGIDILSGSVVVNRDVLFKHISEGSSFFRIKQAGAVRFVTMVKDRAGIIGRTSGT